MVGDTISLMTGADVTLYHYLDYGHMDYMFGTDHDKILGQPLLKWLATDAFTLGWGHTGCDTTRGWLVVRFG